MAHEAIDQWVDGLAPLFEQPTPAQLTDLSDHFQESRQELLGACMKAPESSSGQALVEKLYSGYLDQEWAGCPQCGKTLRRKRLDQKELSTLQGSFVIHRPYFYCPKCRHGFHPPESSSGQALDEALALAPEHHPYDIQQRITATAAQIPFAGSAEHFEDLTGIDVGNHFSHETLNAVGEAGEHTLFVQRFSG